MSNCKKKSIFFYIYSRIKIYVKRLFIQSTNAFKHFYNVYVHVFNIIFLVVDESLEPDVLSGFELVSGCDLTT